MRLALLYVKQHAATFIIELRTAKNINCTTSFSFANKLQKEITADSINSSSKLFGYIENEEIVSVAAYEVLKRLPTPKINNLNSDIAYVCSIYTKEEYRNKGYSKLLLNEVIEDAKKRGLTRFKLSSHNEIAIKLYKKFGFKSDLTAMVKND